MGWTIISTGAGFLPSTVFFVSTVYAVLLAIQTSGILALTIHEMPTRRDVNWIVIQAPNFGGGDPVDWWEVPSIKTSLKKKNDNPPEIEHRYQKWPFHMYKGTTCFPSIHHFGYPALSFQGVYMAPKIQRRNFQLPTTHPTPPDDLNLWK